MTLLGEELGNLSLMVVWRYAFWTTIVEMKEASLHIDLPSFRAKPTFDAFMRPLIEARAGEWPDLELE